MKRSERYEWAMVAVVNNNTLSAFQKIEIIETLLTDKATAVWREEQEEKENNDG